nr:MAG TPA: hypothetical protein [Caudoviricetes sp.]
MAWLSQKWVATNELLHCRLFGRKGRDNGQEFRKSRR